MLRYKSFCDIHILCGFFFYEDDGYDSKGWANGERNETDNFSVEESIDEIYTMSFPDISCDLGIMAFLTIPSVNAISLVSYSL